jgi:hypothetical protein
VEETALANDRLFATFDSTIYIKDHFGCIHFEPKEPEAGDENV